MTGRGRPLRFLLLVLGGWIGLRLYLLWPVPEGVARQATRARAPSWAAARESAPFWPVPMAARYRTTLPEAVAAVGPRASGPRHVAVTPAAIAQVASRSSASPPLPAASAPALDAAAAPAPGYVLALLGLVRYGAAEPAPDLPRTSRWSASVWAIARGGAQAASVTTPQLGGSQAGVRVAYALGDRVALAARAASALGVVQKDAAVGIEWRPTRLPLRLVAEQRIGIERARGGASLGVVGGVSELPLAAGFRLDGYGQAGVIARDDAEGYADGAVRAARVVAKRGGVTLDLGLGAWGAAQRGAARLDAGPSIAAVVPVAGRRVRVSLDWRQRIAGDARPGSGPALSIGGDF